MNDKLFEICDAKRQYLKQRKLVMPESILLRRAKQAGAMRGFHKALKARAEAGQFGLIAEVKKASPSQGVIRADFNPAAIAKAYEAGGAACISVLTDEPYFQGKDEYLTQVKAAVNIPVLRKDFILEPYQVYESRVLGADCILLIVAAISDRQAEELEQLAIELGLDVLVEVHNEDELNRAMRVFRSTLIGINNRDLKTMAVDLGVTEKLAKQLPARITPVCESGISSHEELQRMKGAGVQCFLVGTSLMRQPDIKAATVSLLNG
ncbi:MAG: indole-3-glycerol phosphate synthase TrpC [Rickettsiales bacterium]|nr:indole-3-glycerol phosphate synthase TrpC [Rickettsiales bacterium]